MCNAPVTDKSKSNVCTVTNCSTVVDVDSKSLFGHNYYTSFVTIQEFLKLAEGVTFRAHTTK